jgi:ribonuclease HI
MDKCASVVTPAEGVLARGVGVSDKQRGGHSINEYMQLFGSLLYAAMMTRPDIAYAVQALSRHMNAPGKEHWIAGMRVLRYLRGTRNIGIKYGMRNRNTGLRLVGYSDSDWAGDVSTRRSTTAYVYFMGGGAISWTSRLQPTVALSSTEAEYMAAAAAVQEALHLRQLLKDIDYVQHGATIIYEDNQACIAMSNNPIVQKRSKHIDVRYHFTRERVETEEVKLVYVKTEHQLADLLTKPLQRVKHETLRKQVLGYSDV